MKAINWKFPLQPDAVYGWFSSNLKVEDGILEDFKNLLQTSPGERVCYPDYGIGIRNYLFKPQTVQLKSDLTLEIITQTNRWIPLVKNIKPVVYFASDIVLGNPLYGQIFLPDANSFFLANTLTIQSPTQQFQVKKTLGIIVQ